MNVSHVRICRGRCHALRNVRSFGSGDTTRFLAPLRHSSCTRRRGIPESGAFWTRGTADTQVYVAAGRARRVRLTLSTGPRDGEIRLTTPNGTRRIVSRADQVQDVTIEVPKGGGLLHRDGFERRVPARRSEPGIQRHASAGMPGESGAGVTRQVDVPDRSGSERLRPSGRPPQTDRRARQRGLATRIADESTQAPRRTDPVAHVDTHVTGFAGRLRFLGDGQGRRGRDSGQPLP